MPMCRPSLSLLAVTFFMSGCSTLPGSFWGRDATLPLEGPALSRAFQNTGTEQWSARTGEYVVPDELLKKPGIPNIWPVAEPGRELLSPFGPRRRGFHQGLDIRNPQGASVVAAAAGTVVEVGYEKNWGNFVTLEHADTLQTRYAHLESFIVREGQVLTQGQQLGTVGKTGNATTPHLHYEVLVSGTPRDPRDYLP